MLYQSAMSVTHEDSRIGKYLICFGEPIEVRHGGSIAIAE